jgi:hypothetical protein
VAAVVVVSRLWAVTLPAELHHIRKGYRVAIGESEFAAVVWVMTTLAVQRAVLKIHTHVKLFELLGLSQDVFAFNIECMTGSARHAFGRAV